jgi:hypothetical protein
VVAVARKLEVLLHRLWVSGEAYEPLGNIRKAIRGGGPESFDPKQPTSTAESRGLRLIPGTF